MHRKINEAVKTRGAKFAILNLCFTLTFSSICSFVLKYVLQWEKFTLDCIFFCYFLTNLEKVLLLLLHQTKKNKPHSQISLENCNQVQSLQLRKFRFYLVFME